jgi:uncharacterized membrane protein YcaP (DUF421 family)
LPSAAPLSISTWFNEFPQPLNTRTCSTTFYAIYVFAQRHRFSGIIGAGGLIAIMPGWLITPSMLHDIFALGAPLLEKIARPVIVYLFLVAALRVFGKRELAQLNPFDLVVLLSLSNTVQNAIIGNDNSLTGGIAGALTLLSANYFVVRFLFRHRRLDQIFEGKPTTLVERGKICREALAKELMTRAELMMVLHRQGFDAVDEVEHCVLEPGGGFYVQRKTPDKDSLQHRELISKLDELNRKLDALASR